MNPCAGCSAEVPDGSTLCPACGLVIVSLVLYGFATSAAGQPWFTRSGVLDD